MISDEKNQVVDETLSPTQYKSPKGFKDYTSSKSRTGTKTPKRDEMSKGSVDSECLDNMIIQPQLT